MCVCVCSVASGWTRPSFCAESAVDSPESVRLHSYDCDSSFSRATPLFWHLLSTVPHPIHSDCKAKFSKILRSVLANIDSSPVATPNNPTRKVETKPRTFQHCSAAKLAWIHPKLSPCPHNVCPDKEALFLPSGSLDIFFCEAVCSISTSLFVSINCFIFLSEAF